MGGQAYRSSESAVVVIRMLCKVQGWDERDGKRSPGTERSIPVVSISTHANLHMSLSGRTLRSEHLRRTMVVLGRCSRRRQAKKGQSGWEQRRAEGKMAECRGRPLR